MSNVSRAFNKVLFQVKKHSPQILLVAGVTGGVVSAVMACKATTKVGAILEETKEQVDGIHRVLETPELQAKYVEKYGEEYTIEESKKDLAVTYAKTGLEFAKLYGPSILLGTVSIGCIFASSNIMKKRNLALTAAYAAVDKSFKDYRGRLVERFGKELDRELRYNVKTEQVEENVVDTETGEVKTVTKTVEKIDPKDIPTTSKIFDASCKGWENDPEHNRFFLKQVQNWANDRLRAKGHIFMNEIYDALGIDRTREGSVVGWVYDESDPNLANYVDFGINDLDDERKRAFINGYEKNVWLDFNPDGNVWDLMQ